MKQESTIQLFVTGGTFDKEYDEITGRLYFKDSHVSEMLKLGRCLLDVQIRTLMMVDSLEMTNDDRELILKQCRQSAHSRIVITHGTDTMSETARMLGSSCSEAPTDFSIWVRRSRWCRPCPPESTSQ